MPSSHLILWHPLLLLPSIFPRVRALPSESVVCIRGPKYWNSNLQANIIDEYIYKNPLQNISKPKSLQFSSVAQSCLTLHNPMNRSTSGLSVPHHLLKFAQVMPSSHLILWHPLLLLPSIFPRIREFSNELTVHIRRPNYWNSASASVLPMSTQGWFPLGLTDLISLQSKGLSRAVSSTSLKASVLRYSALFMVQLSHPYMSTRKIIAFTIQTFVGKVVSLLFNTLSGFVVALSRFVTLCHSFVKDQNVLISWLLKKGMRKVSR